MSDQFENMDVEAEITRLLQAGDSGRRQAIVLIDRHFRFELCGAARRHNRRLRPDDLVDLWGNTLAWFIARMKGERFRGAEWSVRTVGPERACLICSGAYDPAMVDLERRGLLDDRSYLDGLDPDHSLRRNENIFPFSMSLAAHEILHLVGLVTGLLGMNDLGDQRYHYNLRQMLVTDRVCDEGCESHELVATGDTAYPPKSFLRDKGPNLLPT